MLCLLARKSDPETDPGISSTDPGISSTAGSRDSGDKQNGSGTVVGGG